MFCASQSHPARGQLQGSAVNFVVQTANLSFSNADHSSLCMSPVASSIGDFSRISTFEAQYLTCAGKSPNRVMRSQILNRMHAASVVGFVMQCSEEDATRGQFL